MSTTTDYFSTQCLPAIRLGPGSCGLTQCDAVIPAPGDLDGLYQTGGDFRMMEAMFWWQWEAKANMAEQSNLFKYLMASKVNLRHKIATEKLSPGLMQIRPYVQVKRKGVINNNYWKAEGGLPCSADGTQPGDSTHWRLDFSSLNGIPVHADWFKVKSWVFVNGLAGDGTSIRWAGQIVSSAVVGAVVRVVLLPQTSGSFLPAARKANPVNGAATTGVPNVSTFESWCAQEPGLISNTLDPYWIGSTRTTFKSCSLYEQWRNLILDDNAQYREIYDLPEQEYNKQVAEKFSRDHVESFMRNTALANQTVSTLADLDDIETTAIGLTVANSALDGAQCVGKRANPIGIYEQHVQCERVVDAVGTKLNLPALFQAIYKMQQIRKATGAPAGAQNVFEIGMSSTYSVLFHQGMLKYYNAQWDGKVQWNMNILETKTAPFGFQYKEYPLVWPNVTLRVITDDFFDHYAAFMHQLAIEFAEPTYDNLGRQVWINDWSRIYMGVFSSMRQVTDLGGRNIDAMHRVGTMDPCVMEMPSETYIKTAFTWTAVADATLGNLMIENLSNEVPEHDAIGNINYDENS